LSAGGGRPEREPSRCWRGRSHPKRKREYDAAPRLAQRAACPTTVTPARLHVMPGASQGFAGLRAWLGRGRARAPRLSSSNHERAFADLVVGVLELLVTTLVVALALRLHRVPLGPSTLPLYFRARATRHALPCRGEVVKPPSAGTGVAPVRRRRDVTSACRRRAIRSPWARKILLGPTRVACGPASHASRWQTFDDTRECVFHVDTSVGMRRRVASRIGNARRRQARVLRARRYGIEAPGRRMRG
jgi:hypothetical protein